MELTPYPYARIGYVPAPGLFRAVGAMPARLPHTTRRRSTPTPMLRVAQLLQEGAQGGFAALINTGWQIGALASPVLVGYIVKATTSFNGGFILMVAAMVISTSGFAMLQPYIASKSVSLMGAA